MPNPLRLPLVATALAATLLGLCDRTALAEPLVTGLPPVEARPWKFQQFPILAWWGPPGAAGREAFEAYRDAGFNLYLANPDSGYEAAMEQVRGVGLKAMPYRTLQGFGLPGKVVNFDEPKDQDAIVGWVTHDEPGNAKAVSEAITAVNALMRQDPTRRVLFNMLPPFGQGDPPTDAVIDAAVAGGLPILSYDQYYIFADGHDAAEGAYASLDQFRRASLKHDVPFWAFALSIRHFDYRRPSESDLRWMQYANLAYGAKGLWYFTYWGPAGWDRWDTRAIVDPKDGSKTELYDYARAINRAVAAMGDTLLKLKNVDVFHVPATLKSQRALPADRHWIAGVDAREAIVSFFTHADGSEYVMVVNARHGMNQSAAAMTDRVTLTFAADVKQVEAVNWLDGKPGAVTIADGRATLEIAGGTGVLLRRGR